MGTSAIIVTYNRINLLKQCILKLLKQTCKLDYIIIINNHSTDGTFKYLTSIQDRHFIIKNLNNNLGGAGGFNIGLKIAYKYTKSNYFWLMDDDAMPKSTALKELIFNANKLHNNFGFLSSNVRNLSDNKAVNVPLTTKDWSQLAAINLIKIREATFVSFFISRKCVKCMGFPIAKAFIWGDDTEYTTRLSRVYPCYFVPNSIVVHNSNSNKKNIYNDSYNRISFYRYSFRNDIYVNRKYFSFTKLMKRVCRVLLILVKLPFKAHNYRILRIYYTIIGFISGFFFNPKIEFPTDRNNKED